MTSTVRMKMVTKSKPNPGAPNTLGGSLESFSTGEIRKEMYRLSEKALDVDNILMSPNAFRRVVAEVAVKNPSLTDHNTGLPSDAKLFGIPVVIDHSMPTDEVAFVTKNSEGGLLASRIKGIRPESELLETLPVESVGDGSVDDQWRESFGD